MLRQWRHWLWRDGGEDDININGGDDNNNGGNSNGNNEVSAMMRITTATVEAAAVAKISHGSGEHIQQSTNSSSRKMAETAMAMAMAKARRQ